MADIESIAVDPSSLRFAEAGKVTGEVGVIFSLSHPWYCGVPARRDGNTPSLFWLVGVIVSSVRLIENLRS